MSVLLSTENPPQIQYVNVEPKYGIAENKLVITVAPQKDIWPHGKTYPKKAVAIRIKIIIIPVIHVFKKRRVINSSTNVKIYKNKKYWSSIWMDWSNYSTIIYISWNMRYYVKCCSNISWEIYC